MNVLFREINPFDFWIWMHFNQVPSEGEKKYIDAIFDSWYVLGRMGAFNSENLQVLEEGSDLSWMNYDNNSASETIPSLMHNLGEIEYQSNWGRCWVDLGTSDGISLDILINAIKNIEGDLIQVNELILGGENEDWPIESHPDVIFSEDT